MIKISSVLMILANIAITIAMLAAIAAHAQDSETGKSPVRNETNDND